MYLKSQQTGYYLSYLGTSPALMPPSPKELEYVSLAALAVRTKAALTNPWAPPPAPRALSPSLFRAQFIPGTIKF